MNIYKIITCENLFIKILYYPYGVDNLSNDVLYKQQHRCDRRIRNPLNHIGTHIETDSTIILCCCTA